MKLDGQDVDLEQSDQEFARMMSAPEKSEQDKLDVPAKPADKKTTAPKASSKPRTTTKAAASKAPVTPATAEQRAAAGASTMHAMAMASTLVGTMTGSEPFRADAAVFAANADPFGQACAELAAVAPSFAKFLDSGSGTVGAYMMFGSVCVSIGVQVAANHGLIKPPQVSDANHSAA